MEKRHFDNTCNEFTYNNFNHNDSTFDTYYG
jgi:hypothetical protein